jgi:hypothetical protein
MLCTTALDGFAEWRQFKAGGVVCDSLYDTSERV